MSSRRLRLSLSLRLAAASLALVAARTGASTLIVTWGDSITYGYYDGTNASNDCTVGEPANDAPENCGYPGRLGNRLDDPTKYSPIYDIDILNLSRGGEKTGNGSPNALTRIGVQIGVPPVCPCEDLEEPCKINSLRYWICNGTVGPEDLFVLEEGTNDISSGVSIETSRENLRQLGLKAEWVGMNVVLSTIIPRHKWACEDPDNSTAENLNDEIAALAASEGWPKADPYTLMKSLSALYNNYYQDWQPMKCDPLNETGVGDPVGHPNSAGYNKMAYGNDNGHYLKSMEGTVRRALPPRLVLTPPSSPFASGTSKQFSLTICDDDADCSPGTLAQTYEITWNFGDGTVETQNVSSSPVVRNHTFWNAGNFTVTVTGEHANGGQRVKSSPLLQVTLGTAIFIDGFESGGTSNWAPGS